MYAIIMTLLMQAPDDPFPDFPPLSEAREYGYTFAFAEEQRLRHARHIEWLVKAADYPLVSYHVTARHWFMWWYVANEQIYAWTMLSGALDERLGQECRREKLFRLRHMLGKERQMPQPYAIVMYPILPGVE